MCKQMNYGSSKNDVTYKLLAYKLSYSLYTHTYICICVFVFLFSFFINAI